MNGAVCNVNTVLEQSMKHCTGVAYKQSTITKHMSELKYLGVAEPLLMGLLPFWQKHWVGNVWRDLGDNKEAIEFYTQALEIRKALFYFSVRRKPTLFTSSSLGTINSSRLTKSRTVTPSCALSSSP